MPYKATGRGSGTYLEMRRVGSGRTPDTIWFNTNMSALQYEKVRRFYDVDTQLRLYFNSNEAKKCLPDPKDNQALIGGEVYFFTGRTFNKKRKGIAVELMRKNRPHDVIYARISG